MKRYLNSLPLYRRFKRAQGRHLYYGLASKTKIYLSGLKGIRSGSRFSRVLRHIFEHKHIKRVLGTNLALLVLVSSTGPDTSGLVALEAAESIILSAPETSLKTEIAVRYPLADKKINQGYSFFHPGVDLEGETGDPIYPIMPGRVENVQYSNYDYGNAILLDHENGYKSFYAHLSKVETGVGEKVNIFGEIGEVGSTGRSTGDHLHLEIYENSKTVNPLTVLP